MPWWNSNCKHIVFIAYLANSSQVSNLEGIVLRWNCGRLSLKSYLIGPSGVGKTTTLLSLTGTSPNEIIPSTGINAPLTVQLYHDTKQSSVLITEFEGWQSQGLSEQCRALCSHILYNSSSMYIAIAIPHNRVPLLHWCHADPGVSTQDGVSLPAAPIWLDFSTIVIVILYF